MSDRIEELVARLDGWSDTEVLFECGDGCDVGAGLITVGDIRELITIARELRQGRDAAVAVVEAADRDHVDYAIDAGHADHEAIAAVIALVQEHEAVKAWMNNEWDADEDFDEYHQRDNALILARNVTHDNAERLMREGRE